MNAYTTIVGFFQSGGLFMYPIVLILALGLAIAIERYIYLSMAKTSNHRIWKKLQPLLQKGDYLQVGRPVQEVYPNTVKPNQQLTQSLSTLPLYEK